MHIGKVQTATVQKGKDLQGNEWQKKKRNLTDGMRIEDAITAGCKNMELDVSWFNEIKWSSDGLHFEEKIEHIKIIGSILKCKSKAVFLF